jgi:lysophospholipase L1-like esterase
MVSEAKSQNVRIALVTVPPQRAGGLRNRGAVAALIPRFNDRVRSLASAEGVGLIDVYDGMKDDISTIGIDDLHPTERGYDVMTTIFFEGIKSLFEERTTFGGSPR